MDRQLEKRPSEEYRLKYSKTCNRAIVGRVSTLSRSARWLMVVVQLTTVAT